MAPRKAITRPKSHQSQTAFDDVRTDKSERVHLSWEVRQ